MNISSVSSLLCSMSSNTDKNDVMGDDHDAERASNVGLTTGMWVYVLVHAFGHWKDISVILYIARSRYKEVGRKAAVLKTIVAASGCIIYSTMP